MTKKVADTEEIPTGWQPAVNQTLAEKLEDRLLAVWPLRNDTRRSEESGEEVPTTVSMVWDITNPEAPELMGAEIPISWTVVRNQLSRSTQSNPWIIGRLKQKGRAYVLEGPKPEEISSIGARLGGIAALIPLMVGDDSNEEPF